jgi:hypothetical protein
MATSHPTSKPNNDAMSLTGGWKQYRGFWTGVIALGTVAAVLAAAFIVFAGREPEPASVYAYDEPATVVTTEAGPLSATVESPQTIASSWSMPPLPEDGSWAASATSQSPATQTSSAVMAIR